MIEKQKRIINSEGEGSLLSLANSLVFGVKKLINQIRSEEDLRVGFEKLLGPILQELRIKTSPKYEKTIYKAGRTDALHGQVVIEYESPFAFRSNKSINHAFDQLIGYIQGLSKSEKETLFIFESKFIGAGFDGEKIFFVRYQGDKYLAKTELDKKDFILLGPYDFDEQSARTLLTHLRALSRLPLNAENLAQKFGPESELAPKAVSALVDALKYWGDQTRIRTFYLEWKRLFGIVYGEQIINGQKNKGAQALIGLYKVGQDTGFQELLFCVHTYFAFLMKLIAAELLTLKETSFHSSFALKLAHSSENELKKGLIDIEDGGVYSRRGITNFLEGDFFRWYIDAWSPRLKEAVQEIARSLADFEPATTSIFPNVARDLLKKLYQYLVPQEVRHNLGEYYTPDWLAELVLNEIKYDGDPRERVLDPACGSGTFLVLAIQKAKLYGSNKKSRPTKIAENILSNIWGFDLNPLAVIAARTNYLFALGDLANEISEFEIPVYIADSVLWPQQVSTQKELNFLGGDYIKVKTSIKEFHIPKDWIKDNGQLIRRAAPLIGQFVKDGFEFSAALKHFKKKGLVSHQNEKIVEEFYREIMELEKQNKNGIWARFLKNVFAPMIAEEFDFVIGNPPWIRWGYLSKEYREATLPLWKNYGLFSLKGHAARLGGGEKDFSMLFAYAAADYYLNKTAKLGFLITQEVFKSKGAGEGFRKFKLGKEGESLRVLKAHDLVAVQPFEGAANKTALIILEKGKATAYPVSYTVWKRKKGVGKIPSDMLLSDAMPLLVRNHLSARPIGGPSGSWQTFSEKQKELSGIEGKNCYRAHEGGYIVPYGIFWIKIKQVFHKGDVLIENLVEKGKWKISRVEEKIEPDLIYPAIRGKDIKRWGASPEILVLVAQDPKLRYGYPEEIMKRKWPQTYSYLLRFRGELLNRAMYKKYHEKVKHPFYSQYNIAGYSFAPYRVIWKHMSDDITAAVISQHKTELGYKQLVSTHTTSLIATNNELEAHYLCAIVNSNPVRDFIKSYSSAGRGFGTPSVMEHVGIAKFDLKNKLHMRLAQISVSCHRLKIEEKEEEITELEKENDELVKKLFSLNNFKT
jgi:hypothetical protein